MEVDGGRGCLVSRLGGGRGLAPCYPLGVRLGADLDPRRGGVWAVRKALGVMGEGAGPGAVAMGGNAWGGAIHDGCPGEKVKICVGIRTICFGCGPRIYWAAATQSNKNHGFCGGSFGKPIVGDRNGRNGESKDIPVAHITQDVKTSLVGLFQLRWGTNGEIGHTFRHQSSTKLI